MRFHVNPNPDSIIEYFLTLFRHASIRLDCNNCVTVKTVTDENGDSQDGDNQNDDSQNGDNR